MSDRRPYNDSVPQEGSIQQGKVIRLEQAFCILQLLDFYRMRGLLHATEMELQGAKIDEAVSLDDVLYCRILSVTTDEGPDGRPRQRIKLSTRGVDTNTGEESASSVLNTQQQQLSQNLNSTIGMGVALDPMANSNLILKSEKSNGLALINGYALVGDTEGEPDLPPPPPEPAIQTMGRGRGTTLPAWMTQGDGLMGGRATEPDAKEAPVRPMGRGRGTTLPAWMTHGGDIGKEEQENKGSRKHNKYRHQEKSSHSRKRDRDDRDRRQSRKPRHRRDERRSRRDSPHDSDIKNSPRERRHREKHHRRRSPSFDSGRDDRGGRHDGDRGKRDEDEQTRRPSPSYSGDSDRGHSRDRTRHDRKSRRRSYSDSSRSEKNGRRPRSTGQTSSGGGSYHRHHHDRKSKYHDSSESHGNADAEFSSVAEAERLIAELEKKKRRCC